VKVLVGNVVTIGHYAKAMSLDWPLEEKTIKRIKE
jgi:hypothetical protein